MKKLVYLMAAAACVSMAACGSKSKADYCQTGSENIAIYTEEVPQLDTLSYAMGANLGLSLHFQLAGIDFDMDRVEAGITDRVAGKQSVTADEAREKINSFLREKYQAYRMALMQKEREAEAAEGQTAQSDMTELPAIFDEQYTREQMSYNFGVDMGENLVKMNAPINLYWFFRAMDDSQKAEKDDIAASLAISEDEVLNALMTYFQQTVPARNAELSEKWLEEVAGKKGVEKTESGLLYRVNSKGGKKHATDDRDIVRVKYEGKLRNGEVFDSSYERAEQIRKMIAELDENQEMTEEQKAGRRDMLQQQLDQSETVEFPLNRVIKGWTEGMKLVGEGGSITLWIPSNLAYGPEGAGRMIGANEALVFNVEIVEVKPYEEPKPTVTPQPINEPAEETAVEEVEAEIAE